MKLLITLSMVAAVSLTGVTLIRGPQFLSDTQAASVGGGACTIIFTSRECKVAFATCQNINMDHFFNVCTSANVGAICVRCSKGTELIDVCFPQAGFSCGVEDVDPEVIDCGVEVLGYCQTDLTCSQVVPDPTDPCDDHTQCCAG